MLREAVRYAVVGSFDLANTIAPILGAPIVFVAMRLIGLPLASPTDVLGGVLLLLATLAAAWVAVVLLRFAYWPWRELRKFRRPSPLEVFVDPNNGAFRQWGENPDEDAYPAEKSGQFYCVEIVNHGSTTVEGVAVVYSYEGQTNHHLAYGTAKSRLALDPASRKMVKLFFRASQEYIGEGEFSDPSPFKVFVRATAKDTTPSSVLGISFQPTGADIHSDDPIYRVSLS